VSEGRLLVFDGTGLLVRCSRASRASGLTADDGTPTGALLMFIASLARTARSVKPDRMVVAWDGPGARAWRQGIYPGYKQGRQDFDFGSAEARQASDFCEAAGIAQWIVAGFEADDLMAFACRSSKPGTSVFLASDDADALQLVSDQTRVITMRRMWRAADVETEWRVPPERLVMLRALVGDRSDGIPGLRYIGPVRALRLMRQANFAWPLPDRFFHGPEEASLVSGWHSIMDLADPLRRPEESASFAADVMECAWAPPEHDKVLPVLERWGLSAISERSVKGGLW
jgi:5'-3' exonuclease